MTRFVDIGTIAELIKGTDLAEMPVFMRPITHLTNLAMLVLHKQIEIALGNKEGRALMKQIVAELQMALASNLVPICPATQYRLKAPILTAGDFKAILAKFSITERKLIIFALGTKMDIMNAAVLKRKDAKILANLQQWSPEIRQLVRSLPASLQCEYLFWQYKPGTDRAEHMLDFGSRFKIATKASWGIFASLVANMAMIDQHSDGEEFRERFIQTGFQQISESN